MKALQATNLCRETRRNPARNALRAPSVEPCLLLSIRWVVKHERERSGLGADAEIPACHVGRQYSAGRRCESDIPEGVEASSAQNGRARRSINHVELANAERYSLAKSLRKIERQIAAGPHVLRERQRRVLDEDGTSHAVYVGSVVQLAGQVDCEASPEVELGSVENHFSQHFAAEPPTVITVTCSQALPELCVGDGQVDATLAKRFERTTGPVEQAGTVLQRHSLQDCGGAGGVAIAGLCSSLTA